MRTVHQNSKPEVSKLLKNFGKGRFHSLLSFARKCIRQPTSFPGFLPKKMGGARKKPWGRGCPTASPSTSQLYLPPTIYIYISCQFIYVHLFIYTFFSAIFVFYLFISFNCLKIIIIFHVSGLIDGPFFCSSSVLHLRSNAGRQFRDNEYLAQCCHALFIRNEYLILD